MKIKVTLHLKDPSKSEGATPEIIQTAQHFFNNDSFWLVAPYKVFEQGVERRIVDYDGKKHCWLPTPQKGQPPAILTFGFSMKMDFQRAIKCG